MLSDIDPVIYPLNRFKICAVLNARGAVEGQVRREMRFAALREEVDQSAATLSKQLTALEKEGYISRFREYGSSRDKDTVWVMLTATGKSAFDAHLAALKSLAEQE
ncbi:MULTISPECIES: transcriptional regulator [Corynebacterium]|uniref:transcriptional regulator n=1 Tax=Corynebacterium TaxID=1716 RepID=UPI0003B8F723|nr:MULTISPECIES: transcriptional regulator [Corynebacterium]ERS53253.1 hypothetical protein HMPREF1267_01182 [Corynebacterium sp. KPL1824]MDK8652930.1 transcriptional regulator [Corynebacterium accolens]WKS57690.1 transcriptional regulator [Corynebacterium accolens]